MTDKTKLIDELHKIKKDLVELPEIINTYSISGQRGNIVPEEGKKTIQRVVVEVLTELKTKYESLVKNTLLVTRMRHYLDRAGRYESLFNNKSSKTIEYVGDAIFLIDTTIKMLNEKAAAAESSHHKSGYGSDGGKRTKRKKSKRRKSKRRKYKRRN